MGLRINNNLSAFEALRNLRITDQKQSQSLERLSTGLRINRASDDPSGLVVSEQLRAQTASLRQATRNAQSDINMINTAEGALQEVNSLLIDIRESIVFALNTGAADKSQIDAEQRSVDRSIDAIDRIAVTTRFAQRSLLNGKSDFQVRSRNALVDDLKIRSVRFANNQSSLVFRVKVTDLASRATVAIASGGMLTGYTKAGVVYNDVGQLKSQAGRVASTTVVVSNTQVGRLGSGQFVTMRITGTIGSEDIKLASGASIRDLVSAVNRVTAATGVFASTAPVSATPGGVRGGGSGFSFALFSVGFGKEQFVRVENLTQSGSNVGLVRSFAASGTANTFNTTLVRQGYIAEDFGDDVEARVDGAQVVAKGYSLRVTSNFLDADVRISERLYQIASYGTSAADAARGSITGSLATSGLAFRVMNNADSGLTFQINSEATSIDRVTVGLASVRSSELGLTIERENLVSSAASNAASMPQGFLTSLKSGAGNDLFQDPLNALTIVDAAIAQVSDVRSFLGSISGATLSPAINSLGVAINNITASESTIRDLDFAAETTEFTRAQILFQAGTSVLASANVIPQAVLTLLQ
ncbi:MAG: hypothetical protein HY719_06680 [Planctomycetes bacterium]|nr:hypothetical protein [Planctomycetota bacterium]